MSVGNRIYLRRNMPPKEIVDGFKQLPASNVADCMGRSCAMDSSIHLMSSSKEFMYGVAITVKARAGDNLFIHQAIEMAGEGDVMVVSTGFGNPNSILGEIIILKVRFKKLAGMVIDAPIRDIDAISKLDFPVYATGFTPGGPYKDGPGEINVPISCGNIAVNPGDIILGDQDGVIVIPRTDAKAILEASIPFSAKDAEKVSKASNGIWDNSWIMKKLNENKVEVIDDCYNT